MILVTLIISAISIIADVALKKAAVAESGELLGMGIVLYAMDALLWYWVYRQAKFSTVAIVYSLFTILLSVIIGFFFFKESINAKEAIGIVLGIGSIVLLGGFFS